MQGGCSFGTQLEAHIQYCYVQGWVFFWYTTSSTHTCVKKEAIYVFYLHVQALYITVLCVCVSYGEKMYMTKDESNGDKMHVQS